VNIKLGGCSFFSSTPFNNKGNVACENKKAPFVCTLKPDENSSSVNSKNGFLTNPPPALKIAAARGVPGNSSVVIFWNALLTDAASDMSVLMPIACPPELLMSLTTPL
jgi:hypothetical protein